MVQNKSKVSKISAYERIISNFYFPIIIILLISIIIRFYFFEPQLPVIFDGRQYFEFAVNVMHNGLPSDYSLDNIGWPIFLSIIFEIFNFNEPIELIQLQKIVSILLSSCTAILVYFLCKKFVDKKFAILGMAIFAFEPRLIENSLLGITEPLFILLVTISLVLFLSNNTKRMYLAFGVISLATIVRAESIFLFFALSIMFFIQTKKDKLLVPKYLIVLSIFFVILSPILFYQLDVRGDDRVFSRIGMGIESGNEIGISFIIEGITNFVKFFAWNIIPIFIIFLPIGFFVFVKKMDSKKFTVLVSGFCMALPALYAYSIPALDTRYLYPLYPLFCVIAVFSLQYLEKKIKFQKNHLILITIGILVISFIFLNNFRINNEYENEVYIFSNAIYGDIQGINSFYPEEKYFKSIEVIKEYPNISFPPSYDIEIVSIDNFKNLEKFIENNTVLTHIIVDSNENRPEFLRDVFQNEEKYMYLNKIYDSSESEFSYHVKVFEINYNIINFDDS